MLKRVWVKAMVKPSTEPAASAARRAVIVVPMFAPSVMG